MESTKPDIAILDLMLRGSSGLELLNDMKSAQRQVPVLVLSMHDEALYAERVLRAGARGYITKNEASSSVMAAIHQVLDGGVYLSEAMTARLLQKMSGQTGGAAKRDISELADRELEVFRLLGYGRSTREIASELGLGEATVNSYRFRIREKLAIKNAAELYNRATQWVQEQQG
jgi:DNA-binding NarL/FixJ family response regulator